MSNVILPIVAIAGSAALGIAAALALPSLSSMNSRGGPHQGSVGVGDGRSVKSIVTYVGSNPQLQGEYALEGTKLSNGDVEATVINMYEDGELYESNVYMDGSFAGKLRGDEWADD